LFGGEQQGVRLFLAWAVMQGVAMLLQNRYQRQRLYTRIALGKVLHRILGLEQQYLLSISPCMFY
jgi:hypothetical protein